mmetsp:Transcript_6756/g.18110  ORF Transcript_6756/g.18110 Transcript_6756/m.18110 type:complete len:293 (+) Transcript_6756:332-1210(+)
MDNNAYEKQVLPICSQHTPYLPLRRWTFATASLPYAPHAQQSMTSTTCETPSCLLSVRTLISIELDCLLARGPTACRGWKEWELPLLAETCHEAHDRGRVHGHAALRHAVHALCHPLHHLHALLHTLLHAVHTTLRHLHAALGHAVHGALWHLHAALGWHVGHLPALHGIHAASSLLLLRHAALLLLCGLRAAGAHALHLLHARHGLHATWVHGRHLHALEQRLRARGHAEGEGKHALGHHAPPSRGHTSHARLPHGRTHWLLWGALRHRVAAACPLPTLRSSCQVLLGHHV